MPIGTLFNLQGLMPARVPQQSVTEPMVLPCGGPTGVGGAFAQGQALGMTGVAAQAQIFTGTVTTNGATGGVGYWVYYGDLVYSGQSVVGGITANTNTTYPTAAQMQNALYAAVPQWSGNLAITGPTGGPYAVTFNNLCAQKQIGGLLQFFFSSATGGAPTLAVTVQQKGSAGSSQVDIYSQASNNRVDAFLMNQTMIDPVGAPGNVDLAGDTGQASGGVPCYVAGYFFADTTNFPEKSVVGLDTNAMTLGKLVFVSGTTLSAPGVIVNLVG